MGGDPRQVGRYQLQARLGSGGMGQVYLGFSPGGRAVAVKVIHPELARDQGFLGRFRREAEAARQVSGLYTAPVVDTSEDGEAPPWLATVFVPGPSLAQAVTVLGPLAEDAVWRLAAGLAEALAAVHASGIVHRDLKPANVLLATDGPRVIDFGISRALEGTAITGTGLTVGTPGFMSPEQADGGRVGSASDVFSLGSLAAFAATGTGPFGDGRPAAVIYRIVHTQPDLEEVPSPLRGLIAACLAKDPAHRPTLARLMNTITARPEPAVASSAVSFWPPALAEFITTYQTSLVIPLPIPSAETVDASSGHPQGHEPTQTASTHHLQEGGTWTVTGHPGHPVTAPSVPKPPVPLPLRAHPALSGKRLRAAFALSILCAASVTAAVLVGLLSHHLTSLPSHHYPAPGLTATSPRPVRALTGHGSQSVQAVAFSPDGKTLAVGDYNGRTYLWDTATRRLAVTLTDPASPRVDAVAFSPDGKTLATSDIRGRTYLWDTATGHLAVTLTDPGSQGADAVTFSPDGKALATGDYNGSTYLWEIRS